MIYDHNLSGYGIRYNVELGILYIGGPGYRLFFNRKLGAYDAFYMGLDAAWTPFVNWPSHTWTSPDLCGAVVNRSRHFLTVLFIVHCAPADITVSRFIPNI